MKTIGYITPFDPFNDRKAWSGTIYKIRESIEKAGFNILWIPVTPPIKIAYILTRIYNKLFKKHIMPDHNSLFYYFSACSIDKKLLKQCDYYFFPTGGEIMPYISEKKPSIYFSDATFHIMIDYYWKNLSSFAISQGEKCEKKAIQSNSIIIRSSKWAAESVIKDYNGDSNKTYVIELGANIDENDINPIIPYSNGTLNILFSGVEWERKRADIAIDTLVELNKRGIDAQLFLVGICEEQIPTNYQNIPNVNYIGFLNKNNPDEYSQYVDIVSKSHLLLLPTKAECAGIVFCEAAGYGLPVFTYDTGGTGNYVINDYNGYRLPLSSTAKDFAESIVKAIYNSNLIKLHKGALDLYNSKLNWSEWSRSFRKILIENNFSKQ